MAISAAAAAPNKRKAEQAELTATSGSRTPAPPARGPVVDEAALPSAADSGLEPSATYFCSNSSKMVTVKRSEMVMFREPTWCRPHDDGSWRDPKSGALYLSFCAYHGGTNDVGHTTLRCKGVQALLAVDERVIVPPCGESLESTTRGGASGARTTSSSSSSSSSSHLIAVDFGLPAPIAMPAELSSPAPASSLEARLLSQMIPPAEMPNFGDVTKGRPYLATPATEAERTAIRQGMQDAAYARLRSGTRRTYSSWVKGYMGFCAKFGYVAVPATPMALAGYASYYVEVLKKSANSLKNMKAAVENASREFGWAEHIPPRLRCYANESGLLCQPGQAAQLEALLKGFKAKAAKPVKHKVAVRESHLLSARQHLELAGRWADPLVQQHWYMFKTAHHLLLRVGEYAEGKLRLEHFFIDEEAPDTIRVEIHNAKTAAPGEVQRVYVVDSDLVRYWKQQLAARPQSAAAFPSLFGADSGLSKSYINTRLQQFLAPVVKCAGDFTSHSLRAGGCTDLAAKKLNWGDIMIQGRWKCAASFLAYFNAAIVFPMRLKQALEAAPASEAVASGSSGRLDDLAPVTGPSLFPWGSAEHRKQMLNELAQSLERQAREVNRHIEQVNGGSSSSSSSSSSAGASSIDNSTSAADTGATSSLSKLRIVTSATQLQRPAAAGGRGGTIASASDAARGASSDTEGEEEREVTPTDDEEDGTDDDEPVLAARTANIPLVVRFVDSYVDNRGFPKIVQELGRRA